MFFNRIRVTVALIVSFVSGGSTAYGWGERDPEQDVRLPAAAQNQAQVPGLGAAPVNGYVVSLVGADRSVFRADDGRVLDRPNGVEVGRVIDIIDHAARRERSVIALNDGTIRSITGREIAEGAKVVGEGADKRIQIGNRLFGEKDGRYAGIMVNFGSVNGPRHFRAASGEVFDAPLSNNKIGDTMVLKKNNGNQTQEAIVMNDGKVYSPSGRSVIGRSNEDGSVTVGNSSVHAIQGPAVNMRRPAEESARRLWDLKPGEAAKVLGSAGPAEAAGALNRMDAQGQDERNHILAMLGGIEPGKLGQILRESARGWGDGVPQWVNLTVTKGTVEQAVQVLKSAPRRDLRLLSRALGNAAEDDLARAGRILTGTADPDIIRSVIETMGRAGPGGIRDALIDEIRKAGPPIADVDFPPPGRS